MVPSLPADVWGVVDFHARLVQNGISVTERRVYDHVRVKIHTTLDNPGVRVKVMDALLDKVRATALSIEWNRAEDHAYVDMPPNVLNVKRVVHDALSPFCRVVNWSSHAGPNSSLVHWFGVSVPAANLRRVVRLL